MFNLKTIYRCRNLISVFNNEIRAVSTLRNRVTFSLLDNTYFRENCLSGLLNAKPSRIFKYYGTAEIEDIDFNTYEKVCEETLESLTEFFEELAENNEKLASADISYSSGVLTVNLGKYGTYVINRQAPNKQIWLSSPISGPKRYDYVPKDSCWIYKHDMKTLHQLLQAELSQILTENIDLSNCLHSKL